LLFVPLWSLLALAVPVSRFTTLTGCMTLIFLGVCAYTDLGWAKIRNSVTYPTLLYALAVAAFDTVFCRPHSADYLADPAAGTPGLLGESGVRLSEHLGAVGFGASLGGAGVAFLIMLVIYHIAGGGGGDVKLATVLGALLGPAEVVHAILWTYVAAGFAIVIWLIVAFGPVRILTWVVRKVGSRLAPALVAPPADERGVLQKKIRLAPFFAIGTMIALSGVDRYLDGLAGG
jgi:Flp pilus assembly protein protease CpaA